MFTIQITNIVVNLYSPIRGGVPIHTQVGVAKFLSVAATSNMEMLPTSMVFSGNNGPFDQSLMIPSTLNDDNRFGSNCSPASGVNDPTNQTHLQQQLHYNGNIALKVEPNTSLDSSMMLLQSSTNTSTALTCNTINSLSSSNSAAMTPSELVSTTSVATNPTSFFQPSPNYLSQPSPGSALSPSSAMNGGNMGNYYSSHPPPASSTSPHSSLHSEFGDDATGNSFDTSTSITTSSSTGKRKTGGVSKAATSTTGK